VGGIPAVKGEEVGPGRRRGDALADAHGTERIVDMSWMLTNVKRFLDDESGPTAVEYAVMLALIIVVCITAITTLGSNANSTFSNVALNAAVGAKSGS